MGNCKIAGLIVAGVLLCALAAFAVEEEIQLEEIGVFGPYKRVERLICDRNGEKWAFVATDEKNLLYIISPAGACGPFYYGVDIAFTGDGSKIVYTYRAGYDDFYVGVEDETWGPFEACTPSAIESVSPRGNNWGFWLWDKGGYYALINGEMWGPYEGMYRLSFSADGSSWGFKACEGGKWFGVVNGEKVGYHDEPYQEPAIPDPVYGTPDIKFSDDGSVWGFPGNIKDEKGRLEAYVVINDNEWGPWPWVGDLAVSLDGSIWGCAVWIEGEAGAIINGEKWPPDGGYVSTRHFTVSDYNGSWAFRASKEEILSFRYAVVNGQEYGPYMSVSEVVFSPDGRQWGATVTKEGGKRTLVIDGVEIEGLEIEGLFGYSDIKFSPLGSIWTACTRRENNFYRIIDGVEYGPFDCSKSSRGDIVFSADDQTWVIGGGNGPVIVNGSEFGVFLDAELFASEAATGFFALEKTGNGYFRLVRWSTGNGS